MDLGESINPAIDIGQIEGAFAQGYGLFMLEQLIHSPDGVLLTRGPGAYKLPGKGYRILELELSLRQAIAFIFIAAYEMYLLNH